MQAVTKRRVPGLPAGGRTRAGCCPCEPCAAPPAGSAGKAGTAGSTENDRGLCKENGWQGRWGSAGGGVEAAMARCGQAGSSVHLHVVCGQEVLEELGHKLQGAGQSRTWQGRLGRKEERAMRAAKNQLQKSTRHTNSSACAPIYPHPHTSNRKQVTPHAVPAC